MADEFVFDPDTLTIGELEDFEEMAEEPFQRAFADPTAVRAKALKAIVWILRRRKEPDLEPDAVRGILVKDVRMTRTPDPTEAASAS